MSNPGPASTVANHPSQLGTNQAKRILAYAASVDLNTVGDTIAKILNTNSKISVQSIIVANASISLTTAQIAVYTGAGATGTAIKTAYAVSGNTTSAKVVITAATSTDFIDISQLYIRCTTAQGAAATADIYIEGYDLSILS